jgi:hypothetical protein
MLNDVWMFWDACRPDCVASHWTHVAPLHSLIRRCWRMLCCSQLISMRVTTLTNSCSLILGLKPNACTGLAATEITRTKFRGLARQLVDLCSARLCELPVSAVVTILLISIMGMLMPHAFVVWARGLVGNSQVKPRLHTACRGLVPLLAVLDLPDCFCFHSSEMSNSQCMNCGCSLMRASA